MRLADEELAGHNARILEMFQRETCLVTAMTRNSQD